MRTPTVATYEIRVVLKAPLPYAFRWCTDYRPDDGGRAHERYQRRILTRTQGRIVYEDLEDSPSGWIWKHTEVTLLPPNRWRAHSVGNRREFRLNYRLRALGTARTELTLRGRRRGTVLGGPNPPRARLERELRTLWRHLGDALAREYRREHPARRGQRR
jgi:hypothetical protein